MHWTVQNDDLIWKGEGTFWPEIGPKIKLSQTALKAADRTRNIMYFNETKSFLSEFDCLGIKYITFD